MALPVVATPAAVAAKLAPVINFHPSERYYPCSVDWLLNRCKLITGDGQINSGPFIVPDSMTVKNAGPMTSDTLAAVSGSTTFGGGELDNISLFPLEAAPGQTPTANNPTSGQTIYFYDYQLQTLLGETLTNPGPNAIVNAESYCRISIDNSGNYLISFFQFYAYNGGLGAATEFGSWPLQGTASGWAAHIGDWTRITATVTIANNLVSLISVDYEAHGDSNIKTGGNWSFSNKSLADIQPIVSFAAWHSHEMYPDMGLKGYHPRPDVGLLANDYTGYGNQWSTAAKLTMISDISPAWVTYNGIFGANIRVPNLPVDRQKNGPQGPAFHGYWITNGQKQYYDHRIMPVPPNMSGRWQQVGINELDITRSFNGTYFPVSTDNQLSIWPLGQLESGLAQRVSHVVCNGEVLWVLGMDNVIKAWQNNQWMPTTFPLTAIGLAVNQQDSTVVVVKPDNTVARMDFSNGKFVALPMPGILAKRTAIDVGGSIWAVDTSNNLQLWDVANNLWQPQDIQARDICACSMLPRIFIVSGDDEPAPNGFVVYEYDGTTLTQVPGNGALGITVNAYYTADGLPFLIGPNGIVNEWFSNTR